MEVYVSVGALLVAVVALCVSYLSWRTSEKAIRASTFDQRFQIYLDAEQFIGAWMRDARPDMGMLPKLVKAWTRSHFLCSEQVTQYLRKLWVDAVKASEMNEIMAGRAEGDRPKAVKEFHALLGEHAEYKQLRTKFMPDLKL